jgi:putative transposase
MPDHVHILISIPPKYSVAEVIGYLKGKSSMATNSGRGAISFRPSDEETIRFYIKNQEIADKQLDQLQLKLASS